MHYTFSVLVFFLKKERALCKNRQFMPSGFSPLFHLALKKKPMNKFAFKHETFYPYKVYSSE